VLLEIQKASAVAGCSSRTRVRVASTRSAAGGWTATRELSRSPHVPSTSDTRSSC